MGEISITPSIIFSIGNIHVTSSHMALFLITIFLLFFGIFMRKRIAVRPGRLQIVSEMALDFFHEKVKLTCPHQKYQKFILYIVFTIFLMVLFSNFFSYFPVVGSIQYNGISFFKTPTAHFSFPLAISLFVVLLSHLVAIVISPLRYIGKFINIQRFFSIRSGMDLFQAFLDVFLGIMDIIGELAKIISLSARLFGNMLAGELMSVIIMGLSFYTQFIAPTPFYILGILTSLIQALVISLLSMQFLGGMISGVLPSTVTTESSV